MWDSSEEDSKTSSFFLYHGFPVIAVVCGFDVMGKGDSVLSLECLSGATLKSANIIIFVLDSLISC